MRDDSQKPDHSDQMGLVYASLLLRNPRSGESMEVRALADSGALLLCIPETIAVELGLQELEKRSITLADGRAQIVSYSGPVEVHFKNRSCFAGALILGNEVLLGAVPMEDMDVLIHPAARELIVNPDHPNMAVSPVKRAAA
jgi:clan AA aspartic protease